MHIVMTVIAVRVQENYNDLRGSKWHKKKREDLVESEKCAV